jgi:hypothetical protein
MSELEPKAEAHRIAAAVDGPLCITTAVTDGANPAMCLRLVIIAAAANAGISRTVWNASGDLGTWERSLTRLLANRRCPNLRDPRYLQEPSKISRPVSTSTETNCHRPDRVSDRTTSLTGVPSEPYPLVMKIL